MCGKLLSSHLLVSFHIKAHWLAFRIKNVSCSEPEHQYRLGITVFDEVRFQRITDACLLSVHQAQRQQRPFFLRATYCHEDQGGSPNLAAALANSFDTASSNWNALR